MACHSRIFRRHVKAKQRGRQRNKVEAMVHKNSLFQFIKDIRKFILDYVNSISETQMYLVVLFYVGVYTKRNFRTGLPRTTAYSGSLSKQQVMLDIRLYCAIDDTTTCIMQHHLSSRWSFFC